MAGERSLAVRGAPHRKSGFWKDHLHAYGKTYIAGIAVVLTGAIAGGAGSVISKGELYQNAAAAAIESLVSGGAVDALLRSLWMSLGFYALVAAGGSHWAVAPFSVGFMALWGIPVGCATTLLWEQGGAGIACAILCVLLPAVLRLFPMLRAWALMLRGARQSLHGEKTAGGFRDVAWNAVWLIPVSILEVTVFPALFRAVSHWF